MYKLLLSITLGIIGLLGVSSQPVGAVASDPDHFVGGDNTFFAFVRAGETIDSEFIRSQYSQNNPAADITIVVEGPDSIKKKCIIKRDVVVGGGCKFKAIKATKTGIWKIDLKHDNRARPITAVSTDVLWGRNLLAWDISIKDSGEEQKGRVWMDGYAFRQPSGRQFTSDFVVYYVSEDGYIYKVKNYGYHGQVSILSADSIGIRSGTECASVYQSAQASDQNLSPTLGSCGNRYKLFFEEPAGNLPYESLRWDGVHEWIRPKIRKPEISELHFIKDDSEDQLSGRITFYLRNFIGQYQVKIDVDNDGSFDGQNDVLLRQQIRELSNKLQNIHFQGVDKTGSIIPTNATIGVKVEITKVAEIHFVASDVEGRKGIEVIRLNGENAPSSRLCWNDTELPPLVKLNFETENKDGRSCGDSEGGVHGWAYGSGSWGDSRHIDDWTYASAKLEGGNTITYPEESNGGATVEKNSTLPAMIAGGLVVLLISVGGIVVVRKRKSNSPIQPPYSSAAVPPYQNQVNQNQNTNSRDDSSKPPLPPLSQG